MILKSIALHLLQAWLQDGSGDSVDSEGNIV